MRRFRIMNESEALSDLYQPNSTNDKERIVWMEDEETIAELEADM
jgi:hypothetical protein